MEFADHFSGHSSEYAAARPTYPAELYSWLASVSPQTECVWDCATGSGQAAFALAGHFKKVIATDASEQQIAHPSGSAENVNFHVAPAEKSNIEDKSVDLITVAQALHWFDFDAFYDEARRVAKPGAILAAWSYELAEVSPEVDNIIYGFYRAIDTYWPPERGHVESKYRTIPFPFESITPPSFEMSLTWKADHMLAYLRTWSAVKRCEKDTGQDPVEAIETDLREVWGSEAGKVTWPLSMLVGRV